MSKGTVLAVDDDKIALILLREFLEEAGYDVVTASDGNEVMGMLEERSDHFDAIVLDRIMPQMDGMAVLKAVKQDMRFVDLPIIMQTSVADHSQTKDAIRAGAYYYVTKPYDGVTLINVVQAAIEKFRQFREVMAWGIEATAGLALLRRGEFEIRTLHEGRMAANLLADLAERPIPVVSGLMELITNAIENGNLGVSGAEKAVFVGNGEWDEEVKRRIFLPENSEMSAKVRFQTLNGTVSVEIEDQGRGFNWERFLLLNEGRAYDTHGRGIAMACAHSFDTLNYSHGGSLVRVTFNAA